MKPIVTPQPADSGAVRGMISALRGRYSFLQALPIGQTALGRDIYGIVLGGGRESVLYAAAFHGQEWITSLILLRLCEEMAAALNGDGVLADMDLQQALAGRSLVMVPQVSPDGEEIALAAGDWLRIAPAAKRQFSAAADSGVAYICIQVRENSLGGFTAGDAVVY